MGGAYEYLMSEWHVTPDYIVNNWTHELFDLMVDKLIERKALRPGPAADAGKVSNKMLFNQASSLIEVKHGN